MFLDQYEVTYTLEDVVQNWKKFDRCLHSTESVITGYFTRDTAMNCRKKIFYEDHEYTTIPFARMRQVFIRSTCICISTW